MFSKGISSAVTVRKQFLQTRFLAFDIVHAVEFSRIGRSRCLVSRLGCQGNSFTCLSPALSRRATCLTYHLRWPCQIDRSGLKSAHQTVWTISRGGLFILRSEDSFLQEVHCYLTRIVVPLEAGSSSAFRTFGVTSKKITCRLGGGQIMRNPGRVALIGYSTKMPARVFLPRRRTAMPPGRVLLARVSATSSTLVLLR
ncbi:hypothetical protein ABIB56_002037 [Glaciihabitans sp. UYNi722]